MLITARRDFASRIERFSPEERRGDVRAILTFTNGEFPGAPPRANACDRHASTARLIRGDAQRGESRSFERHCHEVAALPLTEFSNIRAIIGRRLVFVCQAQEATLRAAITGHYEDYIWQLSRAA